MYLKNERSKIQNILQVCLFSIWALLFIFWFYKYCNYAVSIIRFPFEWEPTDGDHLNFSHRIAQGLSIYKKMANGEVLSIYNPAYHYLLSIFGSNVSFSIARIISSIFWLFCPILIFLFNKNKFGLQLSILASIAIMVPATSGLQIELVNVSPTSMMIFLFILSMSYIDLIVSRNECSYLKLLLAAFLLVLCFFTKQQGIVASAACLVVLIVNRFSYKKIIYFTSTGVILFILITFYLEFQNSFSFLDATFWDLGKVMEYKKSLLFRRILGFGIRNFICVSFAFGIIIYSIIKRIKLNVWEISIIIHIPYLLITLGNGGGGESYWLTFWISIILTIFNYLQRYKTERNRFFLLMFILVFINSFYGIYRNIIEISNKNLPDNQLVKTMELNYLEIAELIEKEKPKSILSNRNTGALISVGFILENEGCTMFSYAWNKSPTFDKSIVLKKVQDKDYDLIVSGLQPFPDDLNKVIFENYYLHSESQVNLIYGNLGSQQIWKPR
ncbi:MAG: hypothetical protein GY756_19190 [bacterium]|nr:hypothetical protein [bacterium]